jgi:glycosyltransferase involved in cell wall biosynthesis
MRTGDDPHTPERPETPATPKRWHYSVIGFLNVDYGLSVAARNTLKALSASARPSTRVSIEPRWLRGAAATAGDRPAAGERNVALFQLNPLDIPVYSRQWRPSAPRGTAHVCVPFWELPIVPPAWERVLSSMDAVLAPTRFVESACAACVPRERILHYPQAVFLPDDVRPSRDQWGLSPTALVVIVSFDVGSDIDRKNPFAAVDAFRRAFPDGEDVQLVIKMKPVTRAELRPQVDALRSRIAGERRIRVIEESLSYDDVFQLYASCDVMLSLHRSEGLGLHLMEAMSVGKVVVATSWSGNTDFMTPENSVLVDYRLVPVATRHPVYRSELGRAGQVWAEPSLDDAVEKLRALRAVPERRRALGAAAARDMEERRRRMLSGETFDALEAMLERTPADVGRFESALQRARLDAYAAALRDLASSVLSRVGLRAR